MILFRVLHTSLLSSSQPARARRNPYQVLAMSWRSDDRRPSPRATAGRADRSRSHDSPPRHGQRSGGAQKDSHRTGETARSRAEPKPRYRPTAKSSASNAGGSCPNPNNQRAPQVPADASASSSSSRPRVIASANAPSSPATEPQATSASSTPAQLVPTSRVHQRAPVKARPLVSSLNTEQKEALKTEVKATILEAFESWMTVDKWSTPVAPTRYAPNQHYPGAGGTGLNRGRVVEEVLRQAGEL